MSYALGQDFFLVIFFFAILQRYLSKKSWKKSGVIERLNKTILLNQLSRFRGSVEGPNDLQVSDLCNETTYSISHTQVKLTERVLNFDI